MKAREFNGFLKKIHNDSHAIEILYTFYYPRIVRHIGGKYGCILAEDVAQEFFLQFTQICDKQEYVEYPTSWVYACAENIAKRKIYHESKYTYLLQETVAAKNDDSTINRLFAEDILKDLNETEREIIYLYYWEGYNQNEIADMLTLTPSNVRQIHSRAIKKLKNILKVSQL